GDGDQRVVEGRLDVRNPGMHDALLAALLVDLLARPRLLASGLLRNAGRRVFDWICHGLHRLLLGNGALARAFAGAGIGLGPLTADRQTPPVPQATITANLHQPLDVERNLLAEVAFHPTHVLDHLADRPDVLFREVLHPGV